MQGATLLNGRGLARPANVSPTFKATAPAVLTLIALLLNLFIDVMWPNSLSPSIALGLYVLAVVQLFKAYPLALVLMVPFIILQVSGTLSLVLIEGGAEMKEVAATGSPSAATSSFVLYALTFLLASVATYTRFSQRSGRKLTDATSKARQLMPLVKNAPLIISMLALGYLLAAGVKTGFPLIDGVDRFAFRRLRADELTLNLLNLKFITAAILGSGGAFANSALLKRLHHIVFVAFLATTYLYGDKFFSILISVSVYVMPHLMQVPEKNILRALAKLAPIAFVAVSAVFGMTLYIYSDYGTRSPAEAIGNVSDRIAGQGQLWFVANRDDPAPMRFDTHIVSMNLANLVNVPSSDYAFRHRLAAFYFVEKYYPRALYASTLNSFGWVTPTMVFEAYGLVAFGYVGLVLLMIAAGVFVGTLMHYLSGMLMTGNMFNIMLPAFVFDATCKMMSQATLYNVFGVSAFKAYAAFALLQLIVTIFLKGASKPLQAPRPAAD